ncbi:MAG: hypothetical protein MH472_07995 [Bacteroidia bacterium]|nr:hypothetical protein [Bacteroidia bacterium]
MTHSLSQFPALSKVWVYAADRTLENTEVEFAHEQLQAFVKSWTAHEMPMDAQTFIFHNQIIVIALNESVHTISGCGIDKSVKLMKELGEKLQINFFDRMLILIKEGEQLHKYTKQSLQESLDAGKLNEDSLVWNPTCTNVGDFLSKSFVKLSDFWMAPQLKFLVQPE